MSRRRIVEQRTRSRPRWVLLRTAPHFAAGATVGVRDALDHHLSLTDAMLAAPRRRADSVAGDGDTDSTER